MLVDNDTFDRFPLSAGQARFAPWCRTPQAERNAASGQGKAASGGALRPAGCVAALDRWQASLRGPRLPGGPQSPIKCVIINEHWYR